MSPLVRRLTVTGIEQVDATRVRQDDGSYRIDVSIVEDDGLAIEAGLSLDAAEALQYAVEQALR